MVGESKVETAPPHARRSPSWKEEGAPSQTALGLTFMKTCYVDLIGYSGVASEQQLWGSRTYRFGHTILTSGYAVLQYTCPLIKLYLS